MPSPEQPSYPEGRQGQPIALPSRRARALPAASPAIAALPAGEAGDHEANDSTIPPAPPGNANGPEGYPRPTPAGYQQAPSSGADAGSKAGWFARSAAPRPAGAEYQAEQPGSPAGPPGYQAAPSGYQPEAPRYQPEAPRYNEQQPGGSAGAAAFGVAGFAPTGSGPAAFGPAGFTDGPAYGQPAGYPKPAGPYGRLPGAASDPRVPGGAARRFRGSLRHTRRPAGLRWHAGRWWTGWHVRLWRPRPRSPRRVGTGGPRRLPGRGRVRHRGTGCFPVPVG